MGEFRPSKPGERRGGRQKGTPNKTTASILAPIMERASEGHGIIRTTTGGAIDTWSLDNPIAGRGRKYHLIIIDEAAFAKESLNEIWESNLRPTLIDFRGKALAMSNTDWFNPENFFQRICTEKQLGWVDFHAPSMNNPYLPPEELEFMRSNYHPKRWRLGLQDFCSRRAPRPRPLRSVCRPPRVLSPASTATLPMCAGDAVGLIAGGEGAANGAGAAAGAGFVATEPAFEAVAGSVASYGCDLVDICRGIKLTMLGG